MKNTKNIIAMIMALITVASLFTACYEGSNGQPYDSSTGIITTSETIAENVPTSGDESTRSPETTSEPETTEPETTEPEETYPEDPNGSKGLTFQKCEDGYKLISMGKCTDTHLVVPKTHNGRLVVEIASSALAGAKIESVFIPETVKRIGNRVFSGCRSLTTVTFSEGLEEIGTYVFENTAVESVVFPKSVIAYYPSALNSQYTVNMVLAGSNIKHITLGGAIDDFGDMLNNLAVESVTFHEGYRVISSNTFKECNNLKRIYLPTTIERVEWIRSSFSSTPDYDIYVNPKSQPNVVFYEHSGNLTKDVKVLASSCFSYNTFKTVNLHEGIISICRNAFYSCKNLESVSIPSSVKYLGNMAFANCEKLKSITLPDGIEHVGANMFWGCTSLQYNEYGNALYIGTKSNPYYMLVKAKSRDIESVDIHKDTKVIDQLAFEKCTKLTSVIVPEGVRKMYSKVFSECTSLRYLYLPDSLESTPDSPVYKCNQLETVRLPKGIDTKPVFTMCSSERITVEGAIKEISHETFEGKRMVEISIPDTVEVIGTAAFRRTTELKSLVLPDKVTTIGISAFEDSAIQSLTLPKSVKYIGYKAFLYSGAGRLTITYPGTKEEFKAIQFEKGWCLSVNKLSVVCTDGELTYSELYALVSQG